MEISTSVYVCDNPIKNSIRSGLSKCAATSQRASSLLWSGVKQSITRFEQDIEGDVMSIPSETVLTDLTGPKVLTKEVHGYTASLGVDFDLIAGILAQVENVDAIYVSNSEGQTHVWTILRDYSDAGLNAVFEQELKLHDYFGQRLESVEFHVMDREAEDGLKTEERIFKRVS